MVMVIKSFTGEFTFLSNFSDSFILYDGILYKNAESMYQAYKCKNKSQRYKLFTGISGAEAKKRGRKIDVRNDWEEVKFSIMKLVVEQKFKQNLSIRKKLLDTGEEQIIEGNYWHDSYWGVCTCDKCKSINGENNLGKILMEVRDYYKQKQIEAEGFEFQ